MDKKIKPCRIGRCINGYVSPKAFNKFVDYKNEHGLTNKSMLEYLIKLLKERVPKQAGIKPGPKQTK